MSQTRRFGRQDREIIEPEDERQMDLEILKNAVNIDHSRRDDTICGAMWCVTQTLESDRTWQKSESCVSNYLQTHHNVYMIYKYLHLTEIALGTIATLSLRLRRRVKLFGYLAVLLLPCKMFHLFRYWPVATAKLWWLKPYR